VKEIRLLLLTDSSVQYVLLHFSELLAMCKPAEQNVYKPWTRRSWTTCM